VIAAEPRTVINNTDADDLVRICTPRRPYITKLE